MALAVFTVNTTADSVDVNPGDGKALDANGLTSLRAAVMEADALSGPSEIILPAGTYLLTIAGSLNASAASGDLDLTRPISIVGAGAADTIIDAHGLGDRVFDVPAGSSSNPLAVSLSGLTVTGGRALDPSSSQTAEDSGGGMRLDVYTTATIDGCVFRDNQAPQTSGSLSYGLGGAISSNGVLDIRNSRFEQNFASNSGGAIYQTGSLGSAAIQDTTFDGNQTTNAGGAIDSSTLLTIDRSTFSNNVARNSSGNLGHGGAIDSWSGCTLTLTNSTLSGNQSVYGGAISNFSRFMIQSSTIAGNQAYEGGGIYGGGSNAKIENSIIAENSATYFGPDLVDTFVSLGHNIVSNTSGSSGFGAVGDLLNVNPNLAPLADNGGPTQTRALLAGSLAIDAANPLTAPATDQRGVARPFGAAPDIGAYEYNIPPNSPPVATNDKAMTQQGVAVVIAVLANDSDPDGDSLTVVSVSSRANGSATINSDGTVTYLPQSAFYGSDSFSYTIDDGHGHTAVGSVTITINAPPAATADSYQVQENNTLNVSAAGGVLANDSDPDGDALSVSVAAPPAHGTLTLNADGSFSYTPSANYFGVDAFTYAAADGHGGTSIGQVTITINAPPAATADSYQVQENNTLNVSAATGVLANDSDPDGDALSISVAAPPAHGTLTLNADGSFSYTPSANYFGADSFTYTASDGNGGTSIAQVTITINAPPAATADSYQVQENNTLNVSAAGGVLANDSDPDGDALSVSVAAAPAHGTLTLNADGSFSYTPSANYFGADAFTYAAADGHGGTSIAQVTITINAPTAAATFAVHPDQINLASRGTITIELFSTSTFDAAQVDVQSVRFAGAAPVQSALADVNDDGRLDLVLHFTVQDTNLLSTYISQLNSDLQRTGAIGSAHRSVSAELSGNLRGGGTFDAFGDVNVFLAGDALRDLAATLKGGSAADDLYVIAVYREILARNPSISELQTWVQLLKSGISHEAFVNAVDHSDEYYATIIRPAYAKYLGREADAAGISFWTSLLRSGLTDEQLEAKFIASDEFYRKAGGTDQGWVDSLYEHLLGRSSDAQGEIYWAFRLHAGERRYDAAFGFTGSLEREAQRVQGDYQQFLGRSADRLGVNYWVVQFAHGMTNERLITGFAASDEYFGAHSN